MITTGGPRRGRRDSGVAGGISAVRRPTRADRREDELEERASVSESEYSGGGQPTDDEAGSLAEPEAADDGPAAEPAGLADAEAEDVDPVGAFKAELRRLPGDWYVVHSYAGYENRVRANLESRTQSLNMEDYIFQIEVPTHEVIEVKGGKRQQVQEKVLP